MPTVGTRARGHDPRQETNCLHEVRSHGGNANAYYNQCNACKFHFEYCPKAAPGLKEVIEALEEHEDLGAQIEGWQPRVKKDQGQMEQPKAPAARRRTATAKARQTAGPRTTSTQPPGDQPTRQIEGQAETETEGWEQLEGESEEESPRSKALSALRGLLQDENANETTNQLVESLRDHLGADISEM